MKYEQLTSLLGTYYFVHNYKLDYDLKDNMYIYM